MVSSLCGGPQLATCCCFALCASTVRLQNRAAISWCDIVVKRMVAKYGKCDVECVECCRLGRFTKHVVSWMTEPKCTDTIRERWYDIWTKCDANFGADLKAKVQAANPGKEAHPLQGATVA